MNRWFAVVLTIIAQFSVHHITEAQDPPPPELTEEEIDAQLYESYKTEVCSRVPAFTGNTAPGPDWSDAIPEDEVLELSFVNMAFGLTSDSITHLKPELGWKKIVIDLISLITKTSCKDDVISESYLNAAKNLYLYYLSKKPSIARNATTPEQREIEWAEIIEALSICANSISPIEIYTQCGIASTFEGKEGGEQTIDETFERLDEEISDGGDIGLDIIIDTVWWMFSTTYSRCYAYFYPNEDVILLFFQLFREDFLEHFLGRWRGAGPNTIHFPIIFGPYDFKSSSLNVRKCATAAFQYEGLSERQLVRPVTVLKDNVAVRNFKIKN